MSICSQFFVAVLCYCLSTYLCEYSILSFWRERTADCWVTWVWTVTLCHIKCPLRIKEVQDKTQDLSLETHILVSKKVLPQACSPSRNAPPANQTFLMMFLITTWPWSSTCRPLVWVVQYVTRPSQQKRSRSLKTMYSATLSKCPSLLDLYCTCILYSRTYSFFYELWPKILPNLSY